MTHEYNTRIKKEALVSNEALAKVEENIITTINCLKEDQKATRRKQKVTRKIW